MGRITIIKPRKPSDMIEEIKSFESDSRAPSGRVHPLVLPDLLPIPKALYPCAHCRDEFSRYAEELYWWHECKCWVCDDCWESESHGEKGIRLDAEILRQNDQLQATASTKL
jgi:hypothetical protein